MNKVSTCAAANPLKEMTVAAAVKREKVRENMVAQATADERISEMV